jgi:AcrR family transcriptional regulator
LKKTSAAGAHGDVAARFSCKGEQRVRGKTEVKRNEIIEAAAEVFKDRGYHGTSMSAISEQLGGSKATIYSYFKSKEELFSATVEAKCRPTADRIMEILDDVDGPVDVILRNFGREFLKFSCTPEIVVIYRTGMTGGAYQSLGPLLYNLGPLYFIDRVERYLIRQINKGRLSIEFPNIAAEQLLSLIECGVTQPLLFGTLPKVTREAAVDAAVGTFLAAYGIGDKPAMGHRNRVVLPIGSEIGY